MKPVNKSLTRSTSDPLHDLQLLKDLQIINERTVKELGPLPPGGLPVQKKRKPKPWNSDAFESTNLGNENEKDETMKLTQIATMAALAIGTAACNPTASVANANTEHAAQTSKASGSSANPTTASTSTTHASVNVSVPRLGPEYKKINSFVAFRKKLLADGWEPVANPKCRNEVSDEYCNLAPEIASYTSTFPGYLITRYVKDGTPLSVLSEGDITDLIEPEKHGLYVDNWDYKNEN